MVVPASGSKRQDFRLGDSAIVHGDAILAGHVVFDKGGFLKTGRVTIAELGREVPVVNGAFRMTGLAPGTWLAEVRSIGLARQAVFVDATDDETQPANITVEDRPPVLDAVTVIGTPSRNSKLVDDIIRRHRASSGTAFLPGNSWLESAAFPADPLRAAIGFRYVNADLAYGRGLYGGQCRASVYLDGMLVPGGFRDLNAILNVRDVLAIEAYQDSMFVPEQWKKQVIGALGDGTPQFPCAIVLVWMKRS